MSIHYRGTCTPVDNVDCRVPCETKWSDRQPYLVMQGYATSVTIDNGIAVIN
jgi:hypothetical protein